MAARAHDVLSRSTDMTSRKRWQWARVFIGARHQGLGALGLLVFSLECARQTRSLAPVLVALRVVPRVKPRRGQRVRPVWYVSPTWAPRALGVLAVGIVLWALLSAPPRVLHGAPWREWLTAEEAPTDWLSRDGDAISVPLPAKRMDRQQAPPCAPAPSRQVEINGGCWMEVVETLPCGQFYEHKGRCYVPVRETPRPPTSVDP